MLMVLAVAGIIFIGAKTVTEIKGYRFIGGGVPATNTISVSGEGEISATPDIATISFTVHEEGKKVSDAQGKVSVKVKAALDATKKLGVADKDIKTANYSSYPKYEYEQSRAICVNGMCPPYPGKQVLAGYEVSQTVTITVRDLDVVNMLVLGLANAGVTNMQGPSFAIDKQDELKAQARKEAISKARAKAEILAHDLGVTLVRIVSFSEGGEYPIYARAMMESAVGGMAKTTPPELPQGEEKITSNVTISYEIR